MKIAECGFFFPARMSAGQSEIVYPKSEIEKGYSIVNYDKMGICDKNLKK
jgi:hypothetical protein